MARKKLPYKEGDWFAVPLEKHGYAIGLIARGTKGAILLGYFFGPPRRTIPSCEDIIDLKAEDAVLIRMFGDLGLLNGEWPIICASQKWNREEWPMPEFVRIGSISGKASLIKYSEDDLRYEINARPCSQDLVGLHPKDMIAGYGAIEIVLTNLLVKKENEYVKFKVDASTSLRYQEMSLESMMETMFYLYFPEESTANRAADLLTREGFDTEVRLSADDVNWLTLGWKKIEPRQLEDTERWMEEFAQSLNGEYDGYEIKVR